MAAGWIGRTALGLSSKIFGFFGSKTSQIKSAVRTGAMTAEEGIEALAKENGLFGKVLKWGGLGIGAETILRGKDGIVGGAANELWTDVGKIEAEQNTIGGIHGFLTAIRELLGLVGIESQWLNGKISELGDKAKSSSKFSRLEDRLTENGEATGLKVGVNAIGATTKGLTGIGFEDDTHTGATVLGAGTALYGVKEYGGVKKLWSDTKKLYQKFSGGGESTTNTPSGGGTPDGSGARGGRVPDGNATIKTAKPSRLSKLMSKIPFIGKHLAILGTVGGAATLALRPDEAEAGTLDTATGEETITKPTDLVDGFAQEATVLGASTLATPLAVKTIGQGTAMFASKSVPGVGAFAAAGDSLYKTGSHLIKGDFAKATTELVAGVGETASAVFGLAGYATVGTAWREGVRELGIKVFGENNGIDNSYIVQAVKLAKEQFTGAASSNGSPTNSIQLAGAPTFAMNN